MNAKSVLDDAVEQVIVMSRIHSRLRTGDADVSVDSEEFILGLGEDLQESMARARELVIECSAISRPLSLAQAVPLGLILNELVTNAIKYAFPDGRTGSVRVSLEECGGQLCLTVDSRDRLGPARAGDRARPPAHRGARQAASRPARGGASHVGQRLPADIPRATARHALRPRQARRCCISRMCLRTGDT